MQKQYWRVYGTDGKAYYVWAENSYDAQLAFSKVYPNVGVSGAIVAWGPTPGANAPTVGGPAVSEQTTTTDDAFSGEPTGLEGYLDEFQRHLGTLGYYNDPIPRRSTKIAEQQYAPLRGLFEAKQVAGGNVAGDTAEQERAFQSFLGGRVPAPQTGGRYMPSMTGAEATSAWNALQGVAGLDAGVGMPGGRTPYQQQELYPTEVGTAGMPTAHMGLGLLGSTMSPLVSGYYQTPTTEQLQRGYINRPEDQAETDFNEYVRKYLGLGSIAGVNPYG